MVVQTNQGAKQEAVRAITGTTDTYNGDWMALFDLYDIPRNDFNGRFIDWLQLVTGSSRTNINDLKQEYATLLGFYNWDSINTFAPSLPNLTAWYDFSDSRYLTLSATAITQVLDKSGNGNNSNVQGTATKRPTLAAAALNGRSVATFDNGDTLVFTSKPSLFAIPNGANTIFIVSKRNTEAGVVDQIYTMTEAGSGRNYIKYSASSGQINFISRTADANLATVTGATNTNYQILMGRRSGTTQAVSFNGGTEATNANGLDEAGVDAMYIGSRADVDSFLDGGIAEMLFYNRSLTAAEIAQINRYLSVKWGISI